MIHRERTIRIEWMEAPGADITDADIAASVGQMLRREYGDVLANLGVDVHGARVTEPDQVPDVAGPRRQPVETTMRFPVVMTQDDAEQLARALHQLADTISSRKPRTAALHVDRDGDGEILQAAAEILWVSNHEI